MSKIAIVKDAAEKAMKAESDRTGQLFTRAEKFLAAAVLVTGYQMSDAAALIESSSWLAKISCLLALAALGTAMFMGLYALRLKGYVGYPRGDKLWEALRPDNVSVDDAELAVIQLLLQTREQNAKLNDAKARSLSWCGWFLLAGVLLAVGGRLLDTFANL